MAEREYQHEVYYIVSGRNNEKTSGQLRFLQESVERLHSILTFETTEDYQMMVDNKRGPRIYSKKGKIKGITRIENSLDAKLLVATPRGLKFWVGLGENKHFRYELYFEEPTDLENTTQSIGIYNSNFMIPQAPILKSASPQGVKLMQRFRSGKIPREIIYSLKF